MDQESPQQTQYHLGLPSLWEKSLLSLAWWYKS